MPDSQSTATLNGVKTSGIKRAISIRQPYAEQILRGIKVREYRSTATKIRERVFIYASLKPGEWKEHDLPGVDRDELPRGVLVGSIEVVGCEWDIERACYAYLLEDPRRLPQPLPPVKHPQPVWFYPF